MLYAIKRPEASTGEEAWAAFTTVKSLSASLQLPYAATQQKGLSSWVPVSQCIIIIIIMEW